MRALSLIGIISFLLLAGACQEPASVKPAPDQAVYFDVPGFIGTQAALLEKENPAAFKSVQENRQARESKTLQNLKWPKELAVFAELDLNKPALRQAFTVTRQAAAGGLVTQTYQKKPDAEGDIAFLAVTTGPDQQVRTLRAVRKNENPLISSSQHLELTCVSKNGRPRIQTYKISGWQKPIIFDSLQYVIITEIR